VASRVVFNNPLMFTEELARFLYIWILFAGIGWVYKKRRNIALDVVARMLNPQNRCLFDIIINIITIIAFSIFIFWSIDFIKFQMINPAPAMRFPMGIVYSIGPVSMYFGIVRIINVCVEDIKMMRDEKIELGKTKGGDL
jgi:TRAP-type C4-dicarboxylate transport system permease small subunit